MSLKRRASTDNQVWVSRKRARKDVFCEDDLSGGFSEMTADELMPGMIGFTQSAIAATPVQFSGLLQERTAKITREINTLKSQVVEFSKGGARYWCCKPLNELHYI